MDPLTCAIAVAREAGALLLAAADGPLDVRQKGVRGDLVTALDRASERLIVERLLACTPHASILGEEDGEHGGTSDERWIVDPLDGTTNFAHGYPMYCVSIAYERAGELVAAALYAPVLDELYAAERGAGATCNGAKLRVTDVASVGDALVCTGFMPGRFDVNADCFAHLSRSAQAVRRDGSAALDLAFTARGRFDAFWELDLHAWDVAAGALLVREAGGIVTAVDGSGFAVAGGSLLAAGPALHGEMRRELDVARR